MNIIQQVNELHKLNESFYKYFNEEVIEGELVDDDVDNMKSANSSDNSDKKQLPAIIENSEVAQKVVAIAQTTNTAVQEIVYTSPNQLTEQKQLEITILYDEAIEQLTEIINSNLESEEDKLEIVKMAKDMVKDYEQANKVVKEKKHLTRQEVYEIIEEQFGNLKDILSAKLPQELIKTIAYSNPITAIVYQNADILGNVGKVAIKTIEKTFNLKGDKKK